MYNLEYLFKGKNKDGGMAEKGGQGAAAKKTNLYDQYKGDIFIANSVFYS